MTTKHITAARIALILLVVPSLACSSNPADLDGSEGEPANLLSAHWLLETFEDPDGGLLPFRDDEQYVLRFETDTTFFGEADCNNYFGTYRASAEGQITVEDIGSTLALCKDESVSNEYYNALQEADRFEVEDRTLKIAYRDGGLLTYREVLAL